MSKIVENNNFHTNDVINGMSSRQSVRLKKYYNYAKFFFIDSVSLFSSLGRGIFSFRLQNRVKNDGTQFKQDYYIVGSPILVRFIAELHARCKAPRVG